MMHIKQASKGKAGPDWLVGQGENGSGCNCFLFFLVWMVGLDFCFPIVRQQSGGVYISI